MHHLVEIVWTASSLQDRALLLLQWKASQHSMYTNLLCVSWGISLYQRSTCDHDRCRSSRNSLQRKAAQLSPHHPHPTMMPHHHLALNATGSAAMVPPTYLRAAHTYTVLGLNTCTYILLHLKHFIPFQKSSIAHPVLINTPKAKGWWTSRIMLEIAFYVACWLLCCHLQLNQVLIEIAQLFNLYAVN